MCKRGLLIEGSRKRMRSSRLSNLHSSVSPWDPKTDVSSNVCLTNSQPVSYAHTLLPAEIKEMSGFDFQYRGRICIWPANGTWSRIFTWPCTKSPVTSAVLMFTFTDGHCAQVMNRYNLIPRPSMWKPAVFPAVLFYSALSRHANTLNIHQPNVSIDIVSMLARWCESPWATSTQWALVGLVATQGDWTWRLFERDS